MVGMRTTRGSWWDVRARALRGLLQCSRHWRPGCWIVSATASQRSRSPSSVPFSALGFASPSEPVGGRTMCLGSTGLAADAAASSSSWSRRPRWADPTRAFSLLVIAIMSVRYLAAKDWDAALLLRGFYAHPGVLVPLLLASAPLLLRKRSGHPLSDADRGAAEWYWWNAWLYHSAMDGLSGSFHVVPVVVQQYLILDRRFGTRHVVPWLVGVVELLVMAPLCVATIHAIVSGSGSKGRRWALELVTSAFQLFGMIAFVGAEVYEGQLNVPALDPVGSLEGGRWANVKLFDFYHLTYYWFGFWFCNLVWGVVPLWRMCRATQECTKAFASASGAANKKVS